MQTLTLQNLLTLKAMKKNEDLEVDEREEKHDEESLQ
jgi:hypothetical protein